MARLFKSNIEYFNTPNHITTGLVDADLQILTAPSDCEMYGLNITRTVVGIGTALVTMTLRDASAGGGLALTENIILDFDAAVPTFQTAGGTGVRVKEGDRLFLNANFDGGTATTAGNISVVYKFRV